MTNEEKTTEKSEVAVETEVPKLSTRDALEVAIAAHKEPEKDEPKESSVADKTPKDSVSIQGGNRGRDAKRDEKASAPLLEPPAQWTKEEKEDFAQLSATQQKAALRLHESYTRNLSEMSRQKNQLVQESAELQWAKDIAKQVEPFLKVRGAKEPVHAQIIKALQAVNQLDTGDPLVNAAEYIKGRGKEVPQALIDAISAQSAGTPSPEIASLRKELDEIKQSKAQEEQARRNAGVSQAWFEFAHTKNAAGQIRFPSIDDSPEGVKLARAIGSLVYDDTPISKAFITSAQARIPNLTWPRLIEEAYRFHGGKVDDSEAPRTDSQDDTKLHLVKSSRAAASRPGNSAQSAGPVKKYADRREAARAAYFKLKEQEES